MFRGALKIGVRSLSGGVLDGSIVDGVENDISTLIADNIDEVIADRLQNTEEDKLAITDFHNYLKELSAKEDEPIVFIIDELDRCRPDFALELVEQIKHLFAVPGITFLLVVNRVQLEESIRTRYGNGVQPTLYLQKFVNIWLSLPRKSSNDQQDNGVQYLKYIINLMLDEGESVVHTEVVDLLSEMVMILKPSFREIEQILSYLALIQNMSNKALNSNYQSIIALVCFLKASKPEIILEIGNSNISGKDLMDKIGLPILFAEDTNLYHIQYLYKWIVYDLGTKEVRKEMIEQREIPNISSPELSNGSITKEICGWLSAMSLT